MTPSLKYINVFLKQLLSPSYSLLHSYPPSSRENSSIYSCSCSLHTTLKSNQMFSSSCNNVSSLFPQLCNPNETMNNNTNDYNNHHDSMLVFDSSSSSSNQIPLTVSFWPTNGYNCKVPILSDTQQQQQQQRQPQPQHQTNPNALNENENPLPAFRQPKGPVKRKDRHSKISTAQGVRDRRVRLSIEIARKFFDLQDLLGFDRASKTLEWLLLKSKKAIKELSSMRSNNNNDNNNNSKQSLCSSNSTCDQIDHDHPVVSHNNKVVGSLDSKREKKLEKTPLVAKESRAKARARARERTKMKMSIRALHDQFKKTCSVPALIAILNHLRSADLKVQMEENGPNNSSYNHQVSEQQHTTTSEQQQQQSLEMKRKLKSRLMIGYHQNLVPSCNNSQPQNLSQNWEITNQISRSSFWTISNMNLSSGIAQDDKLTAILL